MAKQSMESGLERRVVGLPPAIGSAVFRPAPLAEVYRETELIEEELPLPVEPGLFRTIPPIPICRSTTRASRRRRATNDVDARRPAHRAGITRVRVHYSDHLGTTRAKVVPARRAGARGRGRDQLLRLGVRDRPHGRDARRNGASRRGAVPRHEVRPDLSTLRIVPWERDTALCLADCCFDGEPCRPIPRGILRRAIAEAEQRGCSVACGHELEFFLFRRTENGALERYAQPPGLVYRMDHRVDTEGVIRQMEDAVAASACRSSASTRSTTRRSGRSTAATTRRSRPPTTPISSSSRSRRSRR